MQTIVLVDDNMESLAALSEALHLAGFECEAFSSAKEACLALANGRVHADAVVTDWHMPEMDGLALMRMVRQIVPERPPVILVSGDVSLAQAAAAVAAGASAFVGKPIHLSRLIEAIRKAVKSREDHHARIPPALYITRDRFERHPMALLSGETLRAG